MAHASSRCLLNPCSRTFGRNCVSRKVLSASADSEVASAGAARRISATATRRPVASHPRSASTAAAHGQASPIPFVRSSLPCCHVARGLRRIRSCRRDTQQLSDDLPQVAPAPSDAKHSKAGEHARPYVPLSQDVGTPEVGKGRLQVAIRKRLPGGSHFCVKSRLQWWVHAVERLVRAHVDSHFVVLPAQQRTGVRPGALAARCVESMADAY